MLPRLAAVMELLVSAHRNVFVHREFGKGLGDLERAHHAAARNLVDRPPGDVFTLKNDAPRIERLEAGNAREQRCLTRAIGPDQGHNAALPDLQRCVINGLEAAKNFAQSFDLEHHAPLCLKRLPIRLNRSIKPLGKKAMMITSKPP